jgi:predicted enzyme related to lactoylglutathione lyase
MSRTANPACFFEIPATDLARAMTFYQHAFGFDFTRETIHDSEMAFLPFDAAASGISGALVRGASYVPSQHGSLIYLGVADIDATLARVVEQGGSILFPKTLAGEYGLVAEFKDSEGNRIGLFQSLTAS